MKVYDVQSADYYDKKELNCRCLHAINASSSSSSSSSSPSVLAAEQRQILAADERKREFHEQKRNEFESYAEEENDGTLDVAEREDFIPSTSTFLH